MHLEKLAKRVAEELEASLSKDIPADQRQEILDIVQRAMLDSATRTHRDLKETAVICCGPEADLAHKIQEQMDNIGVFPLPPIDTAIEQTEKFMLAATTISQKLHYFRSRSARTTFQRISCNPKSKHHVVIIIRV